MNVALGEGRPVCATPRHRRITGTDPGHEVVSDLGQRGPGGVGPMGGRDGESGCGNDSPARRRYHEPSPDRPHDQQNPRDGRAPTTTSRPEVQSVSNEWSTTSRATGRRRPHRFAGGDHVCDQLAGHGSGNGRDRGDQHHGRALGGGGRERTREADDRTGERSRHRPRQRVTAEHEGDHEAERQGEQPATAHRRPGPEEHHHHHQAHRSGLDQRRRRPVAELTLRRRRPRAPGEGEQRQHDEHPGGRVRIGQGSGAAPHTLRQQAPSGHVQDETKPGGHRQQRSDHGQPGSQQQFAILRRDPTDDDHDGDDTERQHGPARPRCASPSPGGVQHDPPGEREHGGQRRGSQLSHSRTASSDRGGNGHGDPRAHRQLPGAVEGPLPEGAHEQRDQKDYRRHGHVEAGRPGGVGDARERSRPGAGISARHDPTSVPRRNPHRTAPCEHTAERAAPRSATELNPE